MNATKASPFARHHFTDDYSRARKYTSPGRAAAAARKIFSGRTWQTGWWRVVDVRGLDAEFVIDTMSGYLAT